MKDKFECQECGEMVEPNQPHNFEDCQKYKRRRR